MWAFCAGLFNGTYSIFNGKKDAVNYIPNSFITNDNFITWVNQTDIDMPLNSGSIFYDGQDCTQQMDSPYMYAVPSLIYSAGHYLRGYLLIYNLINQSYIPLSSYSATIPDPVTETCVVVDNDNVYVIAGYERKINVPQNPITLVQKYNTNTDQWTTPSPINHKRYNHGCVIINSQTIYIFGGDDAIGMLSSIEKYNIENDEWVMLAATLQIARYLVECQPVANLIYCIGGQYIDENHVQKYPAGIDIFNTLDDSMLQWDVQLNEGRAYHQTVVNDDRILIVGGYGGNGNYLKSIEILDPLLIVPTSAPTQSPTHSPSNASTFSPSMSPTNAPTLGPSNVPTNNPTIPPTFRSNQSSNETDIFHIVIGSVCAVVLVLIMLFLAFHCCRKKRSQSSVYNREARIPSVGMTNQPLLSQNDAKNNENDQEVLSDQTAINE